MRAGSPVYASPPMSDDELEDLTRRLRLFFAGRGARDETDDLAAEVQARVVAAEARGRVIENHAAFAFGTAKLVWLEHLRDRQSAPGELVVEPPAPAPDEGPDPEAERCLGRCLSHLPPESRRLFVGYFAGPGKNKERRSDLAAALGVTPNALQQRIAELRAKLRRCMRTCLMGPEGQHGTGARG